MCRRSEGHGDNTGFFGGSSLGEWLERSVFKGTLGSDSLAWKMPFDAAVSKAVFPSADDMNKAIISGASVAAAVDRLADLGGSLSTTGRRERVFEYTLGHLFRRPFGLVPEHLFAGLRALRHPARRAASVAGGLERGHGLRRSIRAREVASGAAGTRAFLLQMG
jgi:hypothetical protein